MKCPSCGGHNFNSHGKCSFCGSNYKPETVTPYRGYTESVSPFDLAEALKEKAESDRRDSIPQLSTCFKCTKQSLFYDKINDIFDCINPKCTFYHIKILSNTDQYLEIIEKLNHHFENPSYLQVKMFLADKRSWVREYREDEYTCVDFAKDILDFMTQREIRCGYARLIFDNGNGHAIVAFETDYALVYFEPQTGNQEYPQIGKPYTDCLEGIPENSPITNIEIMWNC